MWEDKDRGRFVGKSSNALKISLDPICLHTAQCPHCQGDSSESPRAPGRVLLAPQGCCFLSGNVDPPRPLGVLVHVVQIGGHDEVFGVVQASLVSVLLPAGVIALVGDVALTSTGLELPEVQPGLVVLQTTSRLEYQSIPTERRGLPPMTRTRGTCSQGWLSDLSTL